MESKSTKNSEIPVSAKTTGKRTGTSEGGKIISVNIPNALPRTERNRRKMAIHIIYLDTQGKKRATTVRFGDHDKTDYYEHKDETKRLDYVNRLKNTADPFHPNFWIANLLNGKSTNLSENYNSIVSSLGLGL